MPFAQLIILIGQDFNLTAQASNLRIQLLNLVEQLNDADVPDGFLELLKLCLTVTILLLNQSSQIFEVLARLFIVKQPGDGVHAEHHRRNDCHPSHQAHVLAR